VATVLKRHKPGIKIIVVEPAESSVLLGGPAGPHKIEGIGIGYTPPLWEPSLVDEILSVTTDDGLKYLGTDVFKRSGRSLATP